MIMLAMLAVMMAVIVVSAIMGALHPASNVEVIDPTTLHLQGEFVESNLGTAVEPDGSVTVRLIAEQYELVPGCLQVPVATPVKFRITSADVIHGFLLPDTNVTTMVVPGFVSEVRTRFEKVGDYVMPCHEFLRARNSRTAVAGLTTLSRPMSSAAAACSEQREQPRLSVQPARPAQQYC